MPKNSRRNSDANSLAVSSRISEITREFWPPPSRIPATKWQDILEDESVSHIVGSIREEIVRSAADTICEGYFRRAAYNFVVNCAHEAWMRAFRWVHLEYDDEEIYPSVSDSSSSKETPTDKDFQLPQKVPIVYGRLEKLLRKLPSNRVAISAPKGTKRKVHRAKIKC